LDCHSRYSQNNYYFELTWFRKSPLGLKLETKFCNNKTMVGTF